MDILSRLGVSISGPFSDTLDEIIRGIIKQFGLEDDLEKVSGDNEKLVETAAQYRQAARDLRGVVQDLEAERRTLLKKWSGEAADAFRAKSLAFEKALDGEADDMDTIATLLETAAEACAMAEQLMIDLIVEIIEMALAAAATTAILSLLTAGAAAAIGPLITAAGIAQKALKAVRITSNLADKLSDLAKSLKAIKRAEKLATELKKLGAGKKNAQEAYRMGLDRYRGKVDGIAGGNQADLAQYVAFQATKRGIKKGIVTPIIGQDVGEPIRQAYDEFAPSDAPGVTPREPTAYDRRPESQSFDQRMSMAETATQKKVREDFG
ncbi:WXG100 family type VII secretion target [Streptomyces sp. KM273126]|uniref:WXG100 family type VII secretion target n=1 Tax=Streptomyces sp. KM273126 TaxID=2545247 RepID=UPI00103A909A|nr:WXG100 family type VII secretion target [Streptomyces sp. KM273126]MBA2809415.1 WXG100 family type VII secretion target [Streptomyces sp. KM273126]